MIRAATEDDAAALSELELDLFGPEAWEPVGLLGRPGGPDRTVLVATDQRDLVVGYVATTVAGDVADLLRIGVRGDHQGQGLGGTLLAAAVAAACAQPDVHRMLLEVSETNAAAVALYRRHGFRVVDRRRRYYADGTDALVLERHLG